MPIICDFKELDNDDTFKGEEELELGLYQQVARQGRNAIASNYVIEQYCVSYTNKEIELNMINGLNSGLGSVNLINCTYNVVAHENKLSEFKVPVQTKLRITNIEVSVNGGSYTFIPGLTQIAEERFKNALANGNLQGISIVQPFCAVEHGLWSLLSPLVDSINFAINGKITNGLSKDFHIVLGF